MLDDVAVVAPAKATSDDTLEEIMRIVNIMPWTPPQAELERKGVYPVEPKLFLASTNVKTLNAAYWFSVPIAIQRRFPYVITVLPKKSMLNIMMGVLILCLIPLKFPIMMVNTTICGSFKWKK
jgi:hypothetical protein